MLIVVDEDIPFAANAFARFGEVHLVTSGTLTPAVLRGADALIVRSVTRVDAALLSGSSVRFVGTATAGVDHVDLDYLRARGVTLAHAAGANANAVAEYVVAALLHLRETLALNLERSVLGIIGFGHVGRRVEKYAAALGLRCVLHDPPLARATGDPRFRPLVEIKRECNVITLHVPLERGGPDPTHHLVDDDFLDALRQGAMLINTSRGAVTDSAALKRAIQSGRVDALVLDVWEGEPAIDVELARRCQLATAHIAGHTLDAKMAAVNRLADAFERLVGVAPRGRLAASVGPNQEQAGHGGPALPNHPGAASYETVPDAVRAAFDIAEADHRLRDTLELPAPERAAVFHAIRSERPKRREFSEYPVLATQLDPVSTGILRTLGFRVEDPSLPRKARQ